MRSIDKFLVVISVVITLVMIWSVASALALLSWEDVAYTLAICVVFGGDHVSTIVYYSRWQRDRVNSDGYRDVGDRVKIICDDARIRYGTLKYLAMKDNKLSKSRGRCGGGWVVKPDNGSSVYVPDSKIRNISPLEQLADCAE